jgi:hypothetical protein
MFDFGSKCNKPIALYIVNVLILSYTVYSPSFPKPPSPKIPPQLKVLPGYGET